MNTDQAMAPAAAPQGDVAVRGPFGEDYFERGVARHVSGYTNYRWRPEYVLPLANYLKQRFLSREVGAWNPVRAVAGPWLDYGCAKGYLVRALRLLGVRAVGWDLSEYAVAQAPEDVRPYLKVVNGGRALDDSGNRVGEFGMIIAKDVLEHVPVLADGHTASPAGALATLLKNFHTWLHDFGRVFVVVPLGDRGVYRIREYALDVTHCNAEDEVWWIKQFQRAGFGVDEFHYALPGVKDGGDNEWTKRYPTGNGIFILQKL